MPLVKFTKEKKEIEVPVGANLRNEAIKAGINLNQGLNGIGASVNRFMNCKGMGMCGTCRVLITAGIENTNKLTMAEWLKFKTVLPTPVPDPIPALAYIGHEEEMRLACCTVVQGDITVESGPEVNLFGENFFS
ncbi:2Fe-2S iron-sulfur cluster-binding protein [Anatilimnocola floriformis]|uniref:2Fe-2S iron-sulfur cluster-binding protein n=1 Tax=Anatilimnocola floriformis TaxID=2948575 RepID=UPI0020C2EA6E|nr:2Fe-2S iron-sulfur cluster-binding protein [Anatilimnocola floriformis]